MNLDTQNLELILVKLEKLENSYQNLEKKIDEIYKNTQRMDDHISFVEKTYDKIKTPFHFLMDKVSLLSFSPFGRSKSIQNDNDNDNDNYKDNNDDKLKTTN